jgi:hypothetical protein
MKKFWIGLGKFVAKGIAIGKWEIKITWYF